MVSILTVRDLVLALDNAGIHTERWKESSRSKTLISLWREIVSGESRLVHDEKRGLVRLVTIIYVDVFATDPGTGKRLKLREARQVLTNGCVRKRGLTGSIAEKLQHGESPEKTAKRALQEELGITEVNVRHREETRTRSDSPSYPGLPMHARNVFFETELTADQFRAKGYTEVQENKTTFFEWVPVL